MMVMQSQTRNAIKHVTGEDFLSKCVLLTSTCSQDNISMIEDNFRDFILQCHLSGIENKRCHNNKYEWQLYLSYIIRSHLRLNYKKKISQVHGRVAADGKHTSQVHSV